MNFKKILILVFLIGIKFSIACDCPAFPPLTQSLFQKDNLRQLVFKGKVMKVGACDELAQCTFEVQELYFGKTTKYINAVFECSSDCSMNFAAGEEWIIYAEYIQIEKIKISFCSRSRKIDKANSTEVEQIAYGCSTEDELTFLREKIGIKGVAEENVTRTLAHSNEQPSAWQKVFLLGGSMLFMVIFLIVIKRFLK
jgi:hypothetical protein